MGMEAKKRDWCRWVRHVLNGIIERCLTNRTNELEQFICSELDRLVEGRVPIEQLQISKCYEDELSYKTDTQANIQIAKKIKERTRLPVKVNSRHYFVIIRGNEKQYLRAEDPEYVKKHNLKIDYSYYLSKQFYNPVKKLLTFQSDLFDFNKIYQKYENIVNNMQNNVVSFEKAKTLKKITLSSLRSQIKKKNIVVKASKKPTNKFLKRFF